jgi:hypothetical protein
MVLNNVNLDKLLNFDLGYCELMHVKTSIYYLDDLRKDIFAMISKNWTVDVFCNIYYKCK